MLYNKVKNNKIIKRITMELKEIEFELELAGVGRDQQRRLLSSIKRSGFDPRAVDKKLMLMGIAPVFEFYYDDEEDK
jgi:hypothetical protein